MSAPETSARLSVREFAKRAGCDEKQVRRAIEKGLLVRDGEGSLAESDVDGRWRKPNRRGITKIADAEGADNSSAPKNVRTARPSARGADNPRRRTKVRTDETAEEAAARIVSEQPLLSLPEALQLKENYLARHQQLAYDLKAGSVVMIADVAKAVGAEYATIRKKLLAIPSEHAPALHRLKAVAEIEDRLRSVVVEALEALTLDGLPSA